MSETYTGSKLAELRRYKIEKTVGAKPMPERDWYGLRGSPPPQTFLGRAGFVIEHDSGDLSWMSEKEFTAKYTPVDGSEDTTFGAALAMMKNGIPVYRKAWRDGAISWAFITLAELGGAFRLTHKDCETEDVALRIKDILAEDWVAWLPEPKEG